MRRFYVPLTLLGIGGLGAFLLSQKGQSVVRRMFELFDEAPERWLEWNEDAERELDHIQEALNRIAESLEPHPEMGH